MRFLFGCLLLTLFLIPVQGQNLVPNPSFEIYSQCPNMGDQLNYAVGWFKPTGNTSDYFNACYTGSSNFHPSVPSNYPGFQYAHIGDAYAGFGAYYNPDSREYVSAQLLTPLEAGKTYCVEFWVSLSDSSLNGIASIGAYFSTTPINDQSTIQYLPLNPQVTSDSLIPIIDTINWTLITGHFVAQGGEQYIIIGNFQPDSEIVADTVRPHTMLYSAYYYIDDVSVIKISDCIAGNDTIICFGDSTQLGISPSPGTLYFWLPHEGLNDSMISNPQVSPSVTTIYILGQFECGVFSTDSITITVRNDCNTSPYSGIIFAPNPTHGNASIFYNLSEIGTLEIYNTLGQLVWKDELPPGDRREDIWLPLAEGLYCWRVSSGATYIGQGKIEIIKR